MLLAGGALVLSVLLWLAPDAHRDNVLADIRTFGKSHPTEIPPEDCTVPMGMGPWLTQGAKPASVAYENLCGELRQAELRSGSLRLSMGYEHNGPLDWLLHPLVFANPLLALLGCALLFLGVGPYLEERWGRRTYLAVIAVSALGSAGVRTLVCNSGSLPWTGAQGWLGALVAAFTVVYLTAQVQFVVPSWPPRTLTLPAWSVAAWWLMVRLLAMWWTGVDRAGVIGELAGWSIGLAAGMAVHLGWIGQLQAAAGPALGATMQKVRRMAQKVEEPERDLSPPPSAPSAPIEDARDDESELRDDERPEVDLFALEAAPTPLPALVHGPARRRQLDLPDERDLLGPDAWAEPAPTPVVETAPPTGGNLAWLLHNRPKDGASATPATVADDDLLAALDAAIARPAPPLQPVADEATVMVAQPPPPITGPQPRPVSEATMAYSARDVMRTAVTDALRHGVVATELAVADDVGRDAKGVLHAHCGGTWHTLNPHELQAVAVGVIVHSDDPTAVPQIYIDCIADRGGRDRPAKAVRLCANSQMLQRLAPGQDGTSAFAALATELASGDAKTLPAAATWPGPPWPRFDTPADFVRMWQRAD